MALEKKFFGFYTVEIAIIFYMMKYSFPFPWMEILKLI